MPFRAPVDDLRFALEVAGLPQVVAAGFPDADAETVAAVLEAAGAFATDVLAPLNRPGDVAGARFENGRVFSAPGFADAYRAYAQGGWTSLAAAPEHGGQGLPKAVSIAAFEMTHAANMAFGLCPMLSEAAMEALAAHGTARQKAMHLPRLVSGEWTGTMNLTEPQAGLGPRRHHLARHRRAGREWRLHASTASKIYITWGDHDVADNVDPPRPRPPAQRASRRSKRPDPLPLPPSASWARMGALGRGQRRPAAGQPGAQARRPRLPHLRHALRGRARPNWSASSEPGPRRTCSS